MEFDDDAHTDDVDMDAHVVARGVHATLWLLPDALPRAACDIGCAVARAAPPVRSLTTIPVPRPLRTSSTVPPSLVPPALVAAVHALVRRVFPHVPASHYEPLQLTRYTRGQQYKLHLDNGGLPADNPRIATVLVYLNDVPAAAGGATAFPRLRHSVQPAAGAALVFCPHDGGDELAHAALPVLAGDKVVAQQWLRRCPAP
jgi:hypothetical protein